MSKKKAVLPIKDVVKTVVQNGLLTRVSIVGVPSGRSHVEQEVPKNNQVVLLLPWNTTVRELKKNLRGRFQIRPACQRLSIRGIPLLYGPIASESQRTLQIDLDVVEVDARLQALLDMTGYGSAHERDAIMAKMMIPRMAQKCACGHTLVRLFEPGQQDTVSEHEAEPYPCRKCAWKHGDRGFRRLIPMICDSCKYSLCSLCFAEDNGHQPPGNPYDEVQELALDVARRLASVACWFGGHGHFCGHPVIGLKSEFANEQLREKVQKGRSFELGIETHREQMVLHNGVHWTVRFSDDICNATQSPNLKPLEIDRVVPDGVTIGGMIGARERVKRSGEWSTIVQDLRNRFPLYRTGNGNPANPYVTMRMISYSVEEAVFEIDVRITDGDY